MGRYENIGTARQINRLLPRSQSGLAGLDYYPYGYYPPAPAYYPPAGYYPPARRCWSPYYQYYYAC